MPQASDDLRNKMNTRFGDPVGTYGPIKYLKDAGYALSRQWEWSKPGVHNLQQMTRDEFDCLLFLVHEWDFGALNGSSDHD